MECVPAITRTARSVPMGLLARFRGVLTVLLTQAKVKNLRSWQATARDPRHAIWGRRKMPSRRGARRGGKGDRGVGRTQLEEQPAVQAANPTATVTQADLAAMEKRYQDMLRDALAPFHAAKQTSTAPPSTPVESQFVSDQLLVEAKHLRDFRK
ncbi:histone H2B.3-like [Cucumis melo var. makuwa]|uniref:Histone H2B.3-like n=1 Tax=Cucumis melo var. makuwa TaxID=1194695 RepID=A0A5D3DJE4_CUCMM|nr:histone H2B.3-like [Cucumis melo var. makuwa]